MRMTLECYNNPFAYYGQSLIALRNILWPRFTLVKPFSRSEAPADRIALFVISSMEALGGLPCPDVIDFAVLYQSICILWPVFGCPPQHFVAPLHSCKAFLQIRSTGRHNRPHCYEFDGSPWRTALS